MSTNRFIQNLEKIQDKNNSLLCVGIDPVLDKLPEEFKDHDYPFFEFGKWIVDQTKDHVCAYKPNSAFFEALGAPGIEDLKLLCDYIHKETNIPVIVDAKRGDIGSTAEAYTKYLFNYLQADAVTVNPYMGKDSAQPFLNYKDKGIILLARTSNSSAKDFMDRNVGMYMTVWEEVVTAITQNWNDNGNCLLVMGATEPSQLKECRDIAPDLVYLVPGLGAQGGDIEKSLQYGLRKDGKGLVISSSRSIIYAENPGSAAKLVKDEINSYR